ncbi:hypothetical protein BDV40DRAFT_283693 [Aspergillus tamarii]|uniref:Uncharacterized protein n=1 Tax=Aspergillus tamarii TaxID=41984 RepID=A0A5N6UA42_ASPTM|nr:hypothetical protein BDV40DRAFT_283693 [Aspergillus tamarii]
MNELLNVKKSIELSRAIWAGQGHICSCSYGFIPGLSQGLYTPSSLFFFYFLLLSFSSTTIPLTLYGRRPFLSHRLPQHQPLRTRLITGTRLAHAFARQKVYPWEESEIPLRWNNTTSSAFQ